MACEWVATAEERMLRACETKVGISGAILRASKMTRPSTSSFVSVLWNECVLGT